MSAPATLSPFAIRVSCFVSAPAAGVSRPRGGSRVPRLARVGVTARHAPARKPGRTAVTPLVGGDGSGGAVAPILTE
ncbi:hypothetical protein Aut01nite_38940 [Actinoplanes utahensis]|nr:hypothetical protein Aut01nite_38940 [Actinoplanes utahensis]